MGSLKLNFCNILKMFFIVGLLVRLCSPLAWLPQWSLVSGCVPAGDIATQPVSLPGWQGCGGGQHSVRPRDFRHHRSHLLSLQPEQVKWNKVPHLATSPVLNWCQYCSSGWRDSAYIYLKEFCDKMEMKGEKLTRVVHSHWSRLPRSRDLLGLTLLCWRQSLCHSNTSHC